MSKKVLIAAPIHHILKDWLEANGYECIVREKITQEEGAALISDCIGVVTSTRLLLDKDLIDKAGQLKWIGRMGSGMEIIDVAYAQSKGIACYSSPDGNSNAVAEHALGALLSLNKRILKSNEELKQGIWLRDENRGVELDGKTVGIIGYGNTGAAFAKKLYGFDVKILVFDKYSDEKVPKYMTSCRSLSEIYDNADIVSFHVPLQDDTRYYMNNGFVEQMKKPFILINTSRGEVVDAQALLKGLESRKISGACIDVWENEPFAKMSDNQRIIVDKIMAHPQVIATPHIAGYSVEALYKMSKSLLGKIVMLA